MNMRHLTDFSEIESDPLNFVGCYFCAHSVTIFAIPWVKSFSIIMYICFRSALVQPALVNYAYLLNLLDMPAMSPCKPPSTSSRT